MIPTALWLSTNFSELNKVYFNNELPAPKFRLAHSKSYYGQFQFCSTPQAARVMGIPNGRLTLSLEDRPEKDILNTLLHEMVHAWQYANQLPHGHGADFKRKAIELNRFGWDIQRVGGVASPLALQHFNNARSIVPSTVAPKASSINILSPRQVSAIKRSINVLRGHLILTAEQRAKLTRYCEMIKNY